MSEAGETALEPAVPQSRQPSRLSRRRLSRRSWIVLLAATLVAIVVAGALLMRKHAPPEAARLLPESDGIVYLNAAPLRAATRFNDHPVKHDADYQSFIDATGIELERDLDEAAFALHHMSNPLGPNGPVAFSSIFVGKFDRQRLASYLERVAQSKEQYAGHEIYSVPVEGRIDRVAILDAEKVAVSNTPTEEQIHSILDRQRTAILPFSGNSLLTHHYKDVPLFSLAWGMGRLSASMGDGLKIFGFRIPLSVEAVLIGSLRWTGSLHLRIEEIAPNGAAAALSADSLEALLSVARTAENVLPNAVTSPDTKALLDSVEIQRHDERAVVTAIIPLSLMRKLAIAPDGSATSP